MLSYALAGYADRRNLLHKFVGNLHKFRYLNLRDLLPTNEKHVVKHIIKIWSFQKKYIPLQHETRN